MIKELILIVIGSAIVNNVVLSQFLGLCPFLGVSKKIDTSAGMGAAVIFVITIAAFVTALINKFILVPLQLTYLQTIVFILIIAAGADIALYVVGLIPLLICILIILICFILEFGIIILSYELYYKSLSMCDSIFLTAN